MNALFGYQGYIGSSFFGPKRHYPIDHGAWLSLPGVPIPSLVDGVIWSAGWPGIKNVDDVERNPIRSELQNVWEPLELARRCLEAKKRLLVFCSGCIYDKLNAEGLPHKETDPPNFTDTVYLQHQAKRGELLVQDFSEIATIFRIRVPFDSRRHRRNTLNKLAQFPAVWDSEQSYTWLPDVARAVKAWEEGLINGGVWHVTQPGTMNNFDAVREHLNPQVGRISGGDRPDSAMACARSTAILDSSKLQSVISMTPVKEAWGIACREWKASPCKSTC